MPYAYLKALLVVAECLIDLSASTYTICTFTFSFIQFFMHLFMFTHFGIRINYWDPTTSLHISFIHSIALT